MSEWISVKEKGNLPESLETVLLSDGECVFTGYRLTSMVDDPDDWCCHDGLTVYDVTHWMHLPKPPKG